MGSRVWNPPFEVGFMVKLQAIELGFRTNPNKSLYLGCVWVIDECLKHSDYTRVSLAFSCCFGIIYIVLGVRSLI